MNILDTDFDAIVLGNGDYPSHPIPLEILRKVPYLCCCDGAAMAQIAEGRRLPDAIVGDGDSLDEDFKKRYADIIHIVSEQEYNDLTKATNFCIAQGFKRIVYLGATGKREDHTLGNISHIARFYDELGIEPVMVTDYGWFVPSRGHNTLSSFPRQQVSIFNMTSTQINNSGLAWRTYAYKQWWQGTLNEATGDCFELDSDGICLVFRTFEAKR